MERIVDLGDALKDGDFIGKLYSLEPIDNMLQQRFPRPTPYGDEECTAFLALVDAYLHAVNDEDRTDAFEVMLDIINC